MGVRDITGACWAVAAAITAAALLWSLLDTPPSWDKDFRQRFIAKKFGSGMKKFGSGMKKIRIRDKHPGSATLLETERFIAKKIISLCFAQCRGSGMLIPDPNFFSSRIRLLLIQDPRSTSSN
jgi:hypothetical protein